MIDRMKLVSPSPLPSRREVVEILSKQLDLLSPGATLVDRNVAVPSGVPINMLAEDERGNHLIIDVFDGKNPSWVAHLLHHMHWLEESNGGKSVRAVVLVARISTPAAKALSYLKDKPVECFSVRCFGAGDERFLALERRVPPPGSAKVGTKPAKKALKPVELTSAEIADFLEQAK